MKVRFLDEFGNRHNIKGFDEIVVELPGEAAKIQKKYSQGAVSVISNYEVDVKVSDFDIQGMHEGMCQSFHIIVSLAGKRLKFKFRNCLNVIIENERKAISL